MIGLDLAKFLITGDFQMLLSRARILKIAVPFFLMATLLVGASPGFGRAEESKISVSTPDAMKAALTQLVGKSVTLRLTSGESIAGIVEEVGPSALRLGQLVGKEYFAAVIQLEGVLGVEYRAK
jgi:hypothetical protein